MKNILIDLDDTLLDFKAGETYALKATFAHIGIPATEYNLNVFRKLNADGWKKLERGEITRAELLSSRFGWTFDALGVSGDSALTDESYRNALAEQVFFVDGALELLEILSKDYALYLATNGTASVQEKRLARAGISGYFREIFISQKVGHNKPDARFFEHCLSVMGSRAIDTVMIGDSLSSDVRGANNASIPVVWFNPSREPLPDGVSVRAIAHTLAEIPDILKTL